MPPVHKGLCWSLGGYVQDTQLVVVMGGQMDYRVTPSTLYLNWKLFGLGNHGDLHWDLHLDLDLGLMLDNIGMGV